jgi:glycosyl transferase family 1
MVTTALIEQGHQVMHLGPPGTAVSPQDREADFFGAPETARAALRQAVDSFRPDWVLQVDDSTPLAHAGLESLPGPKAWYAVDSHLHLEWHRHYASLFDRVFCAQQNLVRDLQTFRGAAREAVWLPLAAGSSSGFAPWNDRDWDVSFVGTLDPALNPERTALVDGLLARGQAVNVVRGDFRPVYPASKVVFNQSVRDDLNLRCFEVMALGALLITDRISHSLEDIGVPGTDFLVYARGDAGDLHAKIRWALDHPTEAEAIARRGHAKVIRGHMMGHRVSVLVRTLEGAGGADGSRAASSGFGGPGDRTGPDGQARAGAHVLSHLAAAQEHLSRLSLPKALAAYFAEESRRLALDALESMPGEPYALITLAQLDCEKGAPAEALVWLDRAAADGSGAGAAVDPDPEYSRRYAILRALALAHAGRLAEARQTALAGMRRFPADANLAGIARALGVAVPASS